MEPALPLIFLIGALTDMALTVCPTGNCLRPGEAPPALWIQTGEMLFQSDGIGGEVTLGYDFPETRGPFQPTAALSFGTSGELWIGMGARWSRDLGTVLVEASFMPGFYANGDGPDLGHLIEFRSSFGIGHEFDNGVAVTLVLDHRSNADIAWLNPGLETVSVRVSIPLN